jgi:transposase-like protein
MSVVYFVRRTDGTGPIKIGCSAHLEARIKQLSCDMKAKFTVVATAPGSFIEEGRVHRRFAHLRETGEWFTPTAELLDAIDAVVATGALPPIPEHDREAIFARRYLAGETLQQIANDFDITRERVRQILRRAGVPSLGLRPAHRRTMAPVSDLEREISQKYATGEHGPAALSEMYGLSVSQVYIVLRRTGTETFGASHFLTRKDDSQLTERIAALYLEGKTTKAIADTVGLKFQPAIYKYLRKAGITPDRGCGPNAVTDTDRAKIVAAFKGGDTLKAIQQKYGFAPPTIRNALARHGIVPTRQELDARRIALVKAANAKRRAA